MLYIRILIVQRKTHTERCEREMREREREEMTDEISPRSIIVMIYDL